MKCPKCGSEEIVETTVDQDRMGNDLDGLVCLQCGEVIAEQGDAYECLHTEVERDEIGRRWCVRCGAYLGERH